MAKGSSSNSKHSKARGTVKSKASKEASKQGSSAKRSGKPSEPASQGAPASANALARGAEVRHWLFKSEPDVFSFQDLQKAAGRRTGWDGVRNYQARNFLRDDCRVGDLVVFWHSNAEPPHGAGLAKVVRPGHPDPTQFVKGHDHEDPASDPADPRWMQVEIEALRAFGKPVTMEALRADPRSRGMLLLAKGQRLSIQPLTREQYELVLELGAG